MTLNPDRTASPDLVGDLATTALPAEHFSTVRLDGVHHANFSETRIGALAEAMSALRIGGTLHMETGSDVCRHLPDITWALRKLGAGEITVEQIPGGRTRITVVKAGRSTRLAYFLLYREAWNRVVLAARRADRSASPGDHQERLRLEEVRRHLEHRIRTLSPLTEVEQRMARFVGRGASAVIIVELERGGLGELTHASSYMLTIRGLSGVSLLTAVAQRDVVRTSNTELYAALEALAGLLEAAWPVLRTEDDVLAWRAKVLHARRLLDEHLGPTGRKVRPATDSDLDRIRAEMFVHPYGYGVILVPEGDPLRRHAFELRTNPDDVTLVARADAEGIYRPARDGDVRLSLGQVADLLRERTEFVRWHLYGATENRALVLVRVGSSGAGPDMGLGSLAEAMGLPVARRWNCCPYTWRSARARRRASRPTATGSG